MTPADEQLVVDAAFSRALGHVRHATQSLLAAEDQPTRSLLLGIAGLDLQALFGDVWPEYIDDDTTAAESLAEAERTLTTVIDHVPLALWAALRSLREQVGDGHH